MFYLNILSTKCVIVLCESDFLSNFAQPKTDVRSYSPKNQIVSLTLRQLHIFCDNHISADIYPALNSQF